ncbi:MAG TPA: hypothetical protein VFK35_07525 [Candidatus Limnocylindrales bacterium]|nr:hypothetical protein [Candidatus Limnocylindrales bacterium]
MDSGLNPRRSALWSVAWRTVYRVMRVLDPLVRSWVANRLPGLDGVVDVRVRGRRTGRERHALLTLLRLGDHWYLGHPNGTAGWQRNADAAGWLEIDPPAAHGPRFRAVRLAAGPERDAIIRATVVQQPFPANLLYRLSLRHVAAIGVYHRLDPIVPCAPASPAGPAHAIATDDPTTEGDR